MRAEAGVGPTARGAFLASWQQVVMLRSAQASLTRAVPQEVTLTPRTLREMSVKAWLQGHEFDLQDLADLLPSGDTRVQKDEEGYFLTSVEIDNRAADVSRHQIALTLLARVNGLGRVQNPNFHPVRLSGRYTDEGAVHHVWAVDDVVVRVRSSVAGVVSESAGELPLSPLPAGPRRALLAASNANVAEALAIMGQVESLGWGEMYKVYEIVRDDVKPKTITQLGWATTVELAAFGASANRPDVSGSAARHARLGGGPPRHKMDESEARSFISRVVTEWIDAQR